MEEPQAKEGNHMFKPYEATEGVVQPWVFGPNQEAWLRDLETTAAKQTKGGCVEEDGYCALSRAHVSLGIPLGYGYCCDYKETAVALALRLFAIERIWKMNDFEMLTFKEIAARIRANPQDYFEEPR